MGILSINKSTEFIDYIDDFADIGMTGGKYFMGLFRERNKLIREIGNTHMSRTPFGCCLDIAKCIELILGHAPIHYEHRQFNDLSDSNKLVWSFDFEMPPAANLSPCKKIHITLRFRNHEHTRFKS